MESNLAQNNSSKYGVLKLCFYFTIISDLVLYIAQPLDIMILKVMANRCLMFCNLAAFLIVINYSINHYISYKTQQIITIAFMIGFSLVSYLLSSNGGLYNYIIRISCYLALPCYFLYIDYLKPEKKMINFIFLISILISINFILLSFSKYRYYGYEKFIGTKAAWLTLGYENPNQTGMHLLVMLFILYCAFMYYSKKMLRVLILIDILYIGMLLFRTSSRICILVGALVTAVILFKRNYKVSPFIVTGCLLTPALFLFLYPYIYKKGLIHEFVIGGKTDFSSRSIIYDRVLYVIKDHIIFGDFGTYRLMNTHNGVLSVLSSLGIIGLLIFYIYYFRAYFHILKNGIRSRTAFIAFIGLLAVFIQACAEAALLTGGSLYAGTISILIFLVRLKSEDEIRHE